MTGGSGRAVDGWDPMGMAGAPVTLMALGLFSTTASLLASRRPALPGKVRKGVNPLVDKTNYRTARTN